MESGALLDTTGRPVSGGEVTVGLVDEMPEASEQGPAAEQEPTTSTALPLPVVNKNELEVAPVTTTGAEESSNLSSLAATTSANQQKPNV